MDLLFDARNQLGECLLWCERTGWLFWTDIAGRRLWSYQPDSACTRHWDMPERLASFALTTQGARLLLGLESRLAWLDLDEGRLTGIAAVEAELPGTRINDGRCDRQGRFVFGTMNEAPGHAPIGSFYRLDQQLRLERLPLPPVSIANSICFSPDGKRMYFCDSLGAAIRCCPYGDQLGPDSVFVTVAPDIGEPDGSSVDADGCLWNAQWGAGRVVRYRPDGMIERIVRLPVTQPTCPAFGGPRLQQLFVTSAQIDLAEPERYAGGLFSSSPSGVTGLAESRFGG